MDKSSVEKHFLLEILKHLEQINDKLDRRKETRKAMYRFEFQYRKSGDIYWCKASIIADTITEAWEKLTVALGSDFEANAPDVYEIDDTYTEEELLQIDPLT